MLKLVGLNAFKNCLLNPAFLILHFILQHQHVQAHWLSLEGSKALHKPAETRFAMYWVTLITFLEDEAHLVALFNSDSVRDWAKPGGGGGEV